MLVNALEGEEREQAVRERVERPTVVPPNGFPTRLDSSLAPTVDVDHQEPD
jgi:hypothetical protein